MCTRVSAVRWSFQVFCFLAMTLMPCVSKASDEDWLSILRDANISQSAAAYDAVLYGSRTTLAWNDTNLDNNFDGMETLVGSVVISGAAGQLVSPPDLTGDALELWAEAHAEEIYRILFPGGLSDAMGGTEDAVMSEISVRNLLAKVNNRAKKEAQVNDGEFKAAVEYHDIENYDFDGKALSLILGYNNLFGDSEFTVMVPYRYTQLDDNIDSSSHFVGLEIGGNTAIMTGDSFAWKVGAQLFGSLYYLTSDAIEHSGQVKYGAGIYTVIDKQLPFGQISAALDYKISAAYLPESLYSGDNVFVEEALEYVNELDTVQTITYGANYGIPLLGDDLALNLEVLRSHFRSDDILDDRDTRTLVTFSASYYPTDSFELTVGVNKVYEVEEYDDLGITLGSIFRF